MKRCVGYKFATKKEVNRILLQKKIFKNFQMRRASNNKVDTEESVETADRRRSKVLRRRSVAHGETNDRVAKVVFEPPPPSAIPLNSH